MADIEEVRYCANGTHHNEETPREARHGNFCGYEYRVVTHALSLAPDLVEHLVSIAPYDSAANDSDRVSKSKEQPAPGNETARSDLHNLYRTLTYWCVTWAKKMGAQAPGPAVGAWRNRRGEVVGLPADMTPSAARYAVGVMTKWLELQLDSIFSLDVDEVNYFIQHEMRPLFALNARWPTKMLPRFSDMPCPRCSGPVALYPPQDAGDDEVIICAGACGLWIQREQYEFYIGVFMQQRREGMTATRTTRHLAKKYAPSVPKEANS